MTQPPDHGNVVVVSLKDMYDTLVQLVAKVDLLIQRDEDRGKDLADHEMRLRALETNRWPVPTLNALVGVGALILAIFAFIRH